MTTDAICRNNGITNPYLSQACGQPIENLKEAKAAEPKKVAEAAKKAGIDLLTEGVTHGVVESVAKGRIPAAAHRLLGGALALKAGVEGTHALLEFEKVFGELGKVRAGAIGRENHNLAMGHVIESTSPGVMPGGYLIARQDALIGKNGKIGDNRHTPHVVNQQIERFEKEIAANNPEFVKYQAAFKASLKDGVRESYTHEIKDQKSLDAALRDPAFAKRYENEAPFREGVRAVMWQASQRPDDYRKQQGHVSVLDHGRAASGRVA